jgi:hypothetical protein
MRQISITALLALGFVLSGAAHAQGWIKFVSEQDQFLVNFPGEPTVVETDYVTESNATVPSRVYSAMARGGRYSIKVIDYTDIEAAHVALCQELEAELDRVSPNQCTGRQHFRDLDGAIAYEAWSIRSRYRDGEITYDAFGRVDGVPGHQIQILHPDGSRSFIGLYMYERRLYVLEGTVPGDAPPPGLFQQSLGLVDELGRRIRLESDSEGRYSRVQARYEYVGEEDPVTGEAMGVIPEADDGRIRAPGERTGAWVPED